MNEADRFALSVFSLAFAIKALLESDCPDETKKGLILDFIKLKNRVQLQIRILEQKQRAEKFQKDAAISEIAR